MIKHTPGPWNVYPPTSENPSMAIVAAMRGQVDIYNAPLTTETNANAHLIAAAPDLLAACKAALSALDDDSEDVQSRAARQLYAIETARAAIAKTEGRE